VISARCITGFAQEFGISPGTDIDAETATGTCARPTRKWSSATSMTSLRLHPALRIGSPQYRVCREEVRQSLNMQLNSMKRHLHDYYEEKRQQVEKLRKEMLSATPGAGASRERRITHGSCKMKKLSGEVRVVRYHPCERKTAF
jgi:hypothetical protein